MSSQVIDVDAPIFVDLTQVITIDLTSEGQSSPPHHLSRSPPRKRVTYAPKNASPTKETTTVKADDVGASPLVDRMLTSPVKTKREFIDIDSDGEDVTCGHKKFKRELSVSSDEEAYPRCHAGYDLNNEDLWKPAKVNKSKITFDVSECAQNFTAWKPFVAPPPSSRPDISEPYSSCYTKQPRWDYPGARIIHRFPCPIQALHPSRLHTGHWLPPVRPLKHITSFKTAAGSVTQIQQSGSYAAISSATVGGQPDQPDEEVNPYNKEGTILLWDNDVHVLPGHLRERGPQVKHYTVHDVKFDPCSVSFVSSGNDKSVHIWELDDDTNTFRLSDVWRFGHVPHDLAFKPGESVLAVAERNLVIYSDIGLDVSYSSVFPFPLKKAKHIIGAMAWGYDATASYVFASSEPMDAKSLVGSHCAFDTTVHKTVYTFNEDGAGDAIAITKDGARLALFTRHEEPTNLLQMYDIRRANPEAVLTTVLEPFPRDMEGEVTSADFSPDGIYLALGRNDNQTHVYDSRRLGRVLFDYQHHGTPRTNPGAQSYGIVQIRWVERDRVRPMGLITGGNDGCVRFWDPLRAPKHPNNGIVLAEMSSDIAAFSVGDHYQGERSLIVGDNAGEVSVFDIHPSSFHYMYQSSIKDWLS